jgi:hypothetical protein
VNTGHGRQFTGFRSKFGVEKKNGHKFRGSQVGRCKMGSPLLLTYSHDDKATGAFGPDTSP